MDDAIDWIPVIHLIVTVKCSHSKIKPLWDIKKSKTQFKIIRLIKELAGIKLFKAIEKLNYKK